jgi:hypothetical protein
VYSIDRTDGATTLIGSYGATEAGAIRSGGDLLSIGGLGLFASVTIGDTASEPDHIASIDPETWEATPLGDATSYDRIFGVGFWGDQLHGFVDLGAGQGGAILELDATTGAAELAVQGDIRWMGAATATDALAGD